MVRYIRCGGFREVLRNLDFHVAQIAFAGDSFAFLFVGIIGFGSPRGPAFEATVPVMRDEWFAFVLLRRSMRVYIVDVWEIRLKSVPSPKLFSFSVTKEEEMRQHTVLQ